MLIFIGCLNRFRLFLHMVTICLMYYFFPTKLSNCRIKKADKMHKIFNEFKSVFILQYFNFGYLNNRNIFRDALIFAQSTLSINLIIIIIVQVRKKLGKCTKNWQAGIWVPLKML